jgi:hypothetical protein
VARSLEELAYDLSLSSLAEQESVRGAGDRLSAVAWSLKKPKKPKKPLPDYFIPSGAGGGHKK